MAATLPSPLAEPITFGVDGSTTTAAYKFFPLDNRVYYTLVASTMNSKTCPAPIIPGLTTQRPDRPGLPTAVSLLYHASSARTADNSPSSAPPYHPNLQHPPAGGIPAVRPSTVLDPCQLTTSAATIGKTVTITSPIYRDVCKTFSSRLSHGTPVSTYSSFQASSFSAAAASPSVPCNSVSSPDKNLAFPFPGVATTPSRPAGAPALLPSATSAAARLSSIADSFHNCDGIRPKYHASPVIRFSSASHTSASQPSLPSRLRAPHIQQRGMPLLPFIRPGRSTFFPHRFLAEHGKNEDSTCCTDSKAAAEDHHCSAGVAPSGSGGLVSPSRGVNRSKSNVCDTIQDGGPKPRPHLYSPRADISESITLLSRQKKGTNKEDNTSVLQQRKADRQVQSMLYLRQDCQRKQPSPQRNHWQSLLSSDKDTQVDKAKVFQAQVAESEQQQAQQDVPENSTREASPQHCLPYMQHAHLEGMKSCQLRRQQPLEQNTQNVSQNKSQQQHSVHSPQAVVTQRQQRHQTCQEPQMTALHQDQSRLCPVDRHRVLAHHQCHPISHEQQADPERTQGKNETCGKLPSAITGACMPLPASSSNRTRKQLICHLCLSGAKIAPENRITQVAFPTSRSAMSASTSVSSRDKELPATIPASPTAGSMTPRVIVSAPNAPTYRQPSHEHFTACVTRPAPNCTGGPSTGSGSAPLACSSLYGTLVGVTGGDTTNVLEYDNLVYVMGDGGESNTVECFYEVGGLILCQQCALLPAVHTATQVNALLEEALCYLAEEADIDFSHPALLELHRLALGSSNSTSCNARDGSCPVNTIGFSRRESVSESLHSDNDSEGVYSKSSTGVCYTNRNTTNQNLYPTCSNTRGDGQSTFGIEGISSESDTDISTAHKREHEEAAVGSGGISLLEDTVADVAGNNKENESNRKDPGGDAAQLGGGNEAWEFPFFVEAVNLTTLLQPSCIEVPSATVSPSAAAILATDCTSCGAGAAEQRHTRAATLSADIINLKADETPGTTLETALHPLSDSTAVASDADLVGAMQTVSRISETGVASGRHRKENSDCPPPTASTCMLDSHDTERDSCSTSAYLCPSECTPVFLPREVPERIVFGRCETLKVYVSQAVFRCADAPPTSTGEGLEEGEWETTARKALLKTTRSADKPNSAAAQKGRGRDAANTYRAAHELTGMPTTAAGAMAAAEDQRAVAVKQQRSYAPLVTEAMATAAVPAHASSKAQELKLLAERHEVPAAPQMMISMAPVPPGTAEASEVAEQMGTVPGQRGLAAKAAGQETSDNVASERTTAATVDVEKRVETPLIGTHGATIVSLGLDSVSRANKQCSAEEAKVSALTLHDSTVRSPNCKRPCLERKCFDRTSKADGLDRTGEQTDSQKKITRSDAEGQAEALCGTKKEFTGMKSEARVPQHSRRCSDTDHLPRERRSGPIAPGDVQSPVAAEAAREVANSSETPRQSITVAGDGETSTRMERPEHHHAEEGVTPWDRSPKRAPERVTTTSALHLQRGEATEAKNGLAFCTGCESPPFQAKGRRRTLLHKGRLPASAGETGEARVPYTGEVAIRVSKKASFQPAVYRVAVARGLPEAVYLAHLGHELLHAYIWCTTDPGCFPATIPSATIPFEEENENNLLDRDLKVHTPLPSVNNSYPPNNDSSASGCKTLPEVTELQREGCHKALCNTREGPRRHTGRRFNSTCCPPPQNCVQESLCARCDPCGSWGRVRFCSCPRDQEDENAACAIEKKNRAPKKRTARATKPAGALCADLDDGEKNVEGNTKDDIISNMQTPCRQKMCCTDFFHSVPTTQWGHGQTHGRKSGAQQELQKGVFCAASIPLKRFPPLSLALEEAVCNCVAAALLERRAAALQERLRQLLTATLVWKPGGQDTPAHAGTLRAGESVLYTVPRGTQSSFRCHERISEETQASIEKENEPLHLVPSVPQHCGKLTHAVQRGDQQPLIAGGSDLRIIEPCAGTYSRDRAAQLLPANWHRSLQQEQTILAYQQQRHQHSTQQTIYAQKGYQRLRGRSETRLTQQQQVTQPPLQRKAHDRLKHSHECSGQHYQRAEQQGRVHEEGVGFQKYRTLNKQHLPRGTSCGLPPRREPNSQGGGRCRLLPPGEQLHASQLREHGLQQQISLYTHELRVIQTRLGLMEADSHVIYGKSYKTVRRCVKRVGLRNFLEAARKGKLQQLLGHYALSEGVN